MNKIDTEKIRELCSVCGGSKKVWPTDEFGLREEGVGKIPCPICQAPAAKVEEFLALLQKERNCWSEHNSTGQIIEKACTHLTAQAKQIKELEDGAFAANEEAQIRNDQIKQLKGEKRKLKNQKEYVYKPKIAALAALKDEEKND